MKHIYNSFLSATLSQNRYYVGTTRLSRAVAGLAVGLLFVVCGLTEAGAQPQFSNSDIELIRNRGGLSGGMKLRLPQEYFPNPEISQGVPSLMDGDIDPSFSASVTEGFGYVYETVVQPDGKIIAIGLFQRTNGIRANGIARFNADGTIDTSFNSGTGANLAIRCVALQPDGKIVIAGAFTLFNGTTVRRIVRLNADGSIDAGFSVALNFNAQINDVLLLPSGKILVGGQFQISSARLVRLNSDGTLDTAVTGFNSTIFSVASAPGDKILLGGQFTAPRANVARLNGDLTLDVSMTPTSGGSGYPVYDTLVQPNGKILVAGSFFTFNGTPTDGVVRLNDNGLIDSTFDLNVDPQIPNLDVNGLALQPDGKILVGFLDANGSRMAGVRRFNADATPDATFNTGTGNSLEVVDLNLLADGKILAAGYFVTVNNQQRLRLVKLNSDGSLDAAFGAALSSTGTVYAIKRQVDGKILIGGDFEYVNGVQKRAIARLNSDGTLDETFSIGGGFLGDVYGIETQPDGKILIAGTFGGRDSTFSASGAARVNTDGSFDVSLNNRVDVYPAYAIGLQSDGKIVVVGAALTELGEQTCAMRRNSNGTDDPTFTPPLATSVASGYSLLVQSDDRLFVGGSFNLQGRNGLVKLNNNGVLDSGFSASVGSTWAVKQRSSWLYSGGFTLRRFAPDGNVDPTLDVGTGFNNLIRAIEVQTDGKILAGGLFTTYNGSSVNRLIRLGATGSVDPTFSIGTGPGGDVYSLDLQPDGKILVGGKFLDFNNAEKFSLVRVNGSTRKRAVADFDGDGKTDLSIFRPNGAASEWWWIRSSDGGNGAVQFGAATDTIAAADYTGDGKTDVAFWRPATGQWFVLRSEDFSFYAFPFGADGDVPAPADYDGDGKADAAIFRPSISTWYIMNSGGGTTISQFGSAGDQPVNADYDGDGKADIGIYRPSVAEWWIQRSTAGLIAFQFGAVGDKTVPGDYSGDGKADVAFWRPSNGNWYILRSEDFSFFAFPFGSSTDVPAPGDFDGDGKMDAGVFRPSNSTWYANRSTAGILIQQFGASGDIPLPSAFVR